MSMQTRHQSVIVGQPDGTDPELMNQEIAATLTEHADLCGGHVRSVKLVES